VNFLPTIDTEPEVAAHQRPQELESNATLLVNGFEQDLRMHAKSISK
jgi:hypothetical protein